MQIKKLAAGALGLLMAGATLGFAASLSSFPSPFVGSNGANSLIVVGDHANPADVVGAINVAARLGGEVTTEKTLTVSGTTASESITGEGVALSTSNTKIFLGDNLKKTGLRSILTKDNLPTVLADGTVTDTDASDSYKYNQYVETSDDYSLAFNKDNYANNGDPTLGLFSLTTAPSSSTYLYKTKVVFEKEMNVTTAAGETISLFGNTYTISSSSTGTKLVLFGSSNSQLVGEGETINATVNGVGHTVEVQGVSDSTTAVITVDGITKSVTNGHSYTINGLDVYVDGVYYYPKESQVSQVQLSLGSQTLTLENGKKVKTGTGSSETNIDGTYVSITNSSDKISMLQVYVGGASSHSDFLVKGTSMTDPVWKTFKLDYNSASPDLTDSSRDLVKVYEGGDQDMKLSYTDYKGNEGDFVFAHANSGLTSINLSDGDGDQINVVEGQAMQVNEYFVADAGDYGHLFEITNIDADGSSTGSIELTDVFSGTTYDVLLGSDNASQKVIDGQTYYINVTGNANVYVTWGSSAGYEAVGSKLTMFPLIKGKNGEHLALFDAETLNVTTNDGKTLVLPTGEVVIDRYATGSSYALNLTAGTGYSATFSTLNLSDTGSNVLLLGDTSTGGAKYNITSSNDGSTVTVSVMDYDGVAYTKPGVMLVEEQDDSNNVYTATVSVKSNGATSPKIEATSPSFSYAEQSQTRKSDSDITDYVDLYGLYAVKNANGDQDDVTFYYPDTQMVNNFYVLASDASVSSSGGSSSQTITYNESVPIKTPIAKLVSQVTTADKSSYNMILVGGPAINDLVRELADAGKTKNVTWYRSQGSGTALVDFVSDAWGTGKAALVVAGYGASDTVAAADIVQKYDDNGFASKTSNTLVIKNGVITTQTQ